MSEWDKAPLTPLFLSTTNYELSTMYYKLKSFLLLLLCLCMAQSSVAKKAVSPNGLLSLQPKGEGYVIAYKGQTVLDIPSVGYEGKNAPSRSALKKTRRITTDYHMLTGKRLHCTNKANEYAVKLGTGVKMVIRLYNDGVAFRYELSGLEDEQLPKEATSYLIPEGEKRWIQQWSDAYEGFFPLTTSYKQKAERGFSRPSLSPEGYNNHWGYPALIQPAEQVFALITEANMEKLQSASSLFNDGELYRVCPDNNTLKFNGGWHSPWRVIIVGTLADVVQSTLVTDVSDPSVNNDTQWIQPGCVSWIYWAYNHGSNDYNIICKYVDMAVALRLPYVLIDAEWDEMKDGKTVEDAINYAKSKGIKPMIWYNSSVGWVDGAPGPKYRLNKPEDREKEFAWCERLGVAGVKIDFFSGDTQMNMEYCIDLMECAARHHLLVNFHGATIPRGWQRTYPNLLTTEAVYGAEWYNNVPTFTNKAAAHNATLPFTRNVIGPMDYTPCTFSDSQHPHITSNAHELALTVLYESGLQHLADKPESYLAQPKEVQQFLSSLPNVWDETRFVDGYPGEFAVIARKKGDTWWVAGINGTNEPKSISMNLDFLRKSHDIQVFEDDVSRPWKIHHTENLPTSVKLQPRGGFVFVVKSEE